MTFGDNSKYEGNFERNVICGKGSFLDSLGAFDGFWKDGKVFFS
jgi:hypothetical protein